MDREGFRQYLMDREVPDGKIEPFLSIVERLENYLTESRRGSAEGGIQPAELQAFSAKMIAAGLNNRDNYVALARYAQFLGDNQAFITVVEMVDGSEVMENLYQKLAETLGKDTRDQVFEGIELPPMGTPQAEKPAITQAVMERLEALTDPQTSNAILGDGLRTLQDERYLEGREKYRACENLEQYLHQCAQDFIAQLQDIQRQGGLYFTQEITDEVIDFVRAHPEISQGVRQGNILYQVKIPYMTVEYLAESDEGMKRYYYCHCPWVREALRSGDVQISPRFCNCSAGFMKKPWEVIFEQPLQAEMVETILDGDPWCKVAIRLPEGV